MHASDTHSITLNVTVSEHIVPSHVDRTVSYNLLD
jgi:hypothetical protein